MVWFRIGLGIAIQDDLLEYLILQRLVSDRIRDWFGCGLMAKIGLVWDWIRDWIGWDNG